ncbi:MAG: GDP-L-fucose synthase family protein [Planctomycetota bacterium]
MLAPLPFRKIFVTGHRGMVGSAVCRLRADEYPHVEVVTQNRSDLDLREESQVRAFFDAHRPDAVLFAASRVGGILVNSNYPVEFLADNVRMATATIQAAYASGVSRFLYLGSTCIYPKFAPQPIREDALLSSPLEPTNEAYALAKIVGLKLCQYYRRQYGVVYHSAMPTNLYGPGDNYHPDHSHVIPALIRKIHEAKVAGTPTVAIWGTGTPRREFLYVDDLVEALIHLLSLPDPPDWVNVGYGTDISILELAHAIAGVVGYGGTIATDPTKPDGTPRKLSDSSLLRSTGWQPTTSFQEGLRLAYDDFVHSLARGDLRSQ